MTIGASAVAGLRTLGGAYAVNHNAVQFPAQGSISKTLLGMAMRGRYSTVRQALVCTRLLPLRSVEGKPSRQN